MYVFLPIVSEAEQTSLMNMVTLSKVPCGPNTVGGFGLYRVPCNRQSATDGRVLQRLVEYHSLIDG
jgi:hypothetical protein